MKPTINGSQRASAYNENITLWVEVTADACTCLLTTSLPLDQLP